MSFVLEKLRQRHIWRRIFLERLTEPLHINLLSALVALVGSFRTKVAHDIIVRPFNAFAILQAADWAMYYGIQELTLVEFGVASGIGLMNMARIAERVTRISGIRFRIYGFDTGQGMPPPNDYRDHPDMYGHGDFPMDFDTLRRALPDNTELILGDVAQTVPKFLKALSTSAPIGYIDFDLDYYSSTSAALTLLSDENPNKYLPIAVAYFDDTVLSQHNSWCGAYLAIKEFNASEEFRKIERHLALENSRIYRRALWLKQIYFVHVLDHPSRLRRPTSARQTIKNPYLS